MIKTNSHWIRRKVNGDHVGYYSIVGFYMNIYKEFENIRQPRLRFIMFLLARLLGKSADGTRTAYIWRKKIWVIK